MASIMGDDGIEYEVVQVEAVAAVASINTLGGDFPKNMAEVIEKAMVGAVLFAQEKGITNPDEIRDLMLKARARVKQEFLESKTQQQE